MRLLTSPLFSACVLSLLLSACSKEEAPPPQPAGEPAPIPIPSAPVSGAATSEAPAESSLALKRGMLSLSQDHTTFQPCGETTPLWVIDQTDAMLREIFTNEPKPLDLYIEAHGERTQMPNDDAAARAYRGAFILEEVLYATPPSEANGCKEPAPTYVAAARGNEPFWSVEVADDKLTWRQPEAPQQLVFDAVQAQDAEGTVGYSGAVEGHTIEVFFAMEPCRDSMSGAYFAYSARATFDGKQLKGCARIGD